MDNPAAVVAAQQQVDLSKLPLYHANSKKDVFTAEEWVERVQRAKDAGNWNDNLTTSYVYNALREGALTWYRTLKWSNVNNQVWADVKQAFLEAYGTTHTSRTTTTALHELKQNSDSVIEYYTKVVEVMSDLQALLPPGGLGQPAVGIKPEIAALQGFNGLANDIKTSQVTDLIDFGAQKMIYFVATQIFVSGLKPELRTEVMKQNPVTIMAACTLAQTHEKINLSKKTTNTVGGSIISEITDGDEADQLQLQIDELQKRKTWALSKRPWQASGGAGNFGQNRNPGTANSGSGYNPNNGGNSGANSFRRENPARGKKCHYCKKMNHFQRDCKKRIAENGQMVSPPKGVSEQRTADDPDGHNSHPFSQQGQQFGPMESLFGSLN